jgi:hypothetical protein
MFGKRVSQYLEFQWPLLALTAAVGLARLGLSLAGTPDAAVRWLSMNVLLWAGAVYYGVAVHRRGFGGHKQLLPLVFFQVVVLHAIAVTGILLAIAGHPNVFAAPEFSGPVAQNQWLHALAHLTIGMVVAPLLLWGAASLVLWVTRRSARRANAASASSAAGRTSAA